MLAVVRNSLAGFYKVERREMALVGGDAATWVVWCQLKAWMAWAPHSKHFGGVWRIVRPGEVLTTQRALSAATGLTRDVLRLRLARLAAKGLIDVRPEASATVIEIKGPTGLSIVSNEPTSEKTHHQYPHAIHNPLNPGALDPQPFQAAMPICGIAVALKKPTREKNNRAPITLVTTEITHPTSGKTKPHWGGESKKPYPVASPGDDALDVLAYAQEALRRVVSAREAASFVDQWAAAPWLTAADLRREIDFIAARPDILESTKSVTRIFHARGMRAHYAAVDRGIRLAQREARDCDMSAAIVPLR